VLEHRECDRAVLDPVQSGLGGDDEVADLSDLTGHFVVAEEVRFEHVGEGSVRALQGGGAYCLAPDGRPYQETGVRQLLDRLVGPGDAGRGPRDVSVGGAGQAWEYLG
jgi:hypothetical protein